MWQNIDNGRWKLTCLDRHDCKCVCRTSNTKKTTTTKKETIILPKPQDLWQHCSNNGIQDDIAPNIWTWRKFKLFPTEVVKYKKSWPEKQEDKCSNETCNGNNEVYKWNSFFLLLQNWTTLSAAIDHFTVVCSVTWPLYGSEARVDLVLIQTSLLLLCKTSCSDAN